MFDDEGRGRRRREKFIKETNDVPQGGPAATTAANAVSDELMFRAVKDS